MTDLRAAFVVARRELLERVRTRWFVVATLLGPVFLIAMIVIPAAIASSGTAGTKIDILDATGALARPLVASLATEGWTAEVVPATTTDDAERARIRSGAINGYLRIPADGLATGEIVYQGDNASSQAVQLVLLQHVNGVVVTERARPYVDPAKLAQIMQPVKVVSRQNTGEGEGTSGTGAFLIAYILAFILYMVITLYGVAVMRSVVTEKTSRVMELMVAAVKPRALMAGKIAGVGGAGLLQVAIWLGLGALALAYRDVVLGWFGIAGGDGPVPELATLDVAIVLVFFVLGYFFYAAMYAAVGAMVSSEQDTQQVQMPVTMVLVIGVLCLQVVSNAPRGSSATIMSNIPVWSPILMPMRYVLGGATLGEVAISIAILIASMLLVIRAAAKIYRVGVLMYGKRPSLRELVRWLRH